jgi:SNF2 family DNA or RNA helicase
MGKTIQTLALLHQNRLYPSSRQAGTLIVAPLALIHQWKREIETKSAQKLRVYIHHGAKRLQLKEQIRQFDVVLTTYNIVSLESPQPDREQDGEIIPGFGGGVLFKANFQRVILDESQLIKNHRTTASLACSQLLAIIRFSLSGTPIQNSIDDIFSQFRFLRVPIWGEWEIFYEEISRVIRKENLKECKNAIHKVQAVLRGILLRRTKDTIGSDGKPILSLPEKFILEEKVTLSPIEKAFYDAIEGKASTEFDRLLDTSGNPLSLPKLYSTVLVLLLRLRQAASHPHLIAPVFELAKKGKFNLDFMDSRRLVNGPGSTFPTATAPTLQTLASSTGSKKARKVLTGSIHHRLSQMALNDELMGQECPLCFDVMQNEVFTKCGHIFCKECIDQVLNSTHSSDSDVASCPCPICRKQIKQTELYPASWFVEGLNMTRDDIQTIVPKNSTDTSSKELESILLSMHPSGQFDEWITSSKIKKLLEILVETRKRDRTIKTVIFSQWTGFLNLIQTALNLHRFQFVRYDGTMSVQERVDAVDSFTSDKSKTVALISLRAGGVGLNLTCASQVVLMDLWWNPKVEDQSIDRVHRIGQTRPVRVYRISVSETIEDRILELQEQKRSLADGALGEDDEFRMPKLTMDDLRFLFRRRQ